VQFPPPPLRTANDRSCLWVPLSDDTPSPGGVSSFSGSSSASPSLSAAELLDDPIAIHYRVFGTIPPGRSRGKKPMVSGDRQFDDPRPGPEHASGLSRKTQAPPISRLTIGRRQVPKLASRPGFGRPHWQGHKQASDRVARFPSPPCRCRHPKRKTAALAVLRDRIPETEGGPKRRSSCGAREVVRVGHCEIVQAYRTRVW
jgi:hypothetical protein